MKHLIGLLAIASMATWATPTRAQDEPQEPVVQQAVQMSVIASDDGSAPMIFSSSSDGGLNTFSMVPGGGIAMMAGEGGLVMPAPDPWSMINNPSVQKDLELVGDQLKKVQEMQQRQGEEIRRQMESLRSADGLKLPDVKLLGDAMKRLREEHQEQLKQLLLPHQIDRLKQVALQTHMNQAGAAGALANKELAEELGISDEQIQRLKEKSKELNKQLAEEIKQLRETMKNELLNELTPEQQKKLKDMTGDKYEPNDEDWKERFNGGIRRVRRGAGASGNDD